MSPALKPRVLIADDQQDVLEAVRLLLKGEQYEIETAKSPAGILAALEARDFDAVLMDLNYARDTTSGAEGLDLISDLHATQPHVPLIAMTGWGQPHDRARSREAGFDHHLVKPADLDALQAIMASIQIGES